MFQLCFRHRDYPNTTDYFAVFSQAETVEGALLDAENERAVYPTAKWDLWIDNERGETVYGNYPFPLGVKG